MTLYACPYCENEVNFEESPGCCGEIHAEEAGRCSYCQTVRRMATMTKTDDGMLVCEDCKDGVNYE